MKTTQELDPNRGCPDQEGGECIHEIQAVVNAVVPKDIKSAWLPKQSFVAEGTATVAVAFALILGIRLRLHNHAQAARLRVGASPAGSE